MRLSKKQKTILKIIGTMAVIAGAFVAPNILQLIKPKNAAERYRCKKSIDRLFRDDVIYLSGERIELTKRGEEMLKYISSEDIEIGKKEEWDGVWHIVCYDVPEGKKKERDYFRGRLMNFGFKVIQDSLWVFPYITFRGRFSIITFRGRFSISLVIRNSSSILTFC